MKRVASAFDRRGAVIACCALALLAGAASQRAAESPAPAPTTGDATTPAMRVAIDPETGQLGMPVHTEAAGRTLDPKAAAGPLPEVETRADGTQILHVKGHFRNYSMVRLAEDGRVETHCTTDATGAQCFLHGENVTPAPEVR